MSVRLKRALSDVEPAGRPLRSITHPDLDLATDESDQEETQEEAEEAELSDSMETPSTPSRMTRSRSRSIKREVASPARSKLGNATLQHLRSPSPNVQTTSAIPSAVSSRSTPPRHPNRAGSAKKKGVISPTSSTLNSPTPPPSSTPKRGSNKKKELTPSLRKGSDARREQTAAQIRAESARLEKLFLETEQKRKQQESERKERTRKRASKFTWVILAAVILPTVFALGWSMLSSNADLLELLPGGVGSLLAALVPAFSSGPQESFSDALTRLHTALADGTHLNPRQINVIENALLAHEEGYRTAVEEARMSAGGDGSTGEAEWNSASVGLFQPPKPLVLVLLTSPSSTPLGDQLVSHLSQQLRPPSSSSPIPLVDFTLECEKHMGKEVRHWTKEGSKEVLHNFFSSRPPRTLHPSLAHGLVFLRSAQTLPRTVAEVFHRYADDVAAPVRDVVYVFQVETTEDRGDAGAVAAEVLTKSWTVGGSGVDEVIQPLLSRVIRNVVDLRGVQ